MRTIAAIVLSALALSADASARPRDTWAPGWCEAIGGHQRGVACVVPATDSRPGAIILPGKGRQPSKRAIRDLCRAFDQRDFRAARVGISSAGAILAYDHDSISCESQ